MQNELLATKNVRTNNSHFPALDGLRGVACLLVVLVHWFAHIQYEGASKFGYIGVGLFFTLSGFLMGYLYLDKRFERKAVVSYVVARFSRIVPAYYLSVFIYFILSKFLPDFHPMSLWILLRHICFSGSVIVYWSIAPEVQFYFFFVLIWWAFDHYKQKDYRPGIVVLAISLFFVLTRARWPGLALPSKFHLFFLGMMGSRLVSSEAVMRILGRRETQFLLILFLVVLYFSPKSVPELYLSLPTAVFVALVVPSFCVLTICTRFFSTKTMKLLGEASFSIYLFHELVMTLMFMVPLAISSNWIYRVVLLILSVILPIVFFKACERKLNQRMKKALLNYLT